MDEVKTDAVNEIEYTDFNKTIGMVGKQIGTESPITLDKEQETPAVAPEIKEVPAKEDPNRFEYWQSKFAHEQAERKKIEDKLQEFEKKLTPVTQVEELKPPQPPMPKPKDYDAVEAITNPNSLSFQWREANEEYKEKLLDYKIKTYDKELSEIKTEKQKREESDKWNQQMGWIRSQYETVGAEKTEAEEMVEFFSSKASVDPKNALIMFRAVKGNSSPKKIEEIETRKTKQEIPLPPGVSTPTTVVDDKFSFGVDMLRFTKEHRI